MAEVKCRGGCLRKAMLKEGKLPLGWKAKAGRPYCPICSVQQFPKDLHILTILRIGPQDFNVVCENIDCDFSVTKTSRELAKIASFDHLKQLLQSAT